MIKKQDFTDFADKLLETENTYFDKIQEMESSEMSYLDDLTKRIYEKRIDAIEHALHELDMLEFELYT